MLDSATVLKYAALCLPPRLAFWNLPARPLFELDILALAVLCVEVFEAGCGGVGVSANSRVEVGVDSCLCRTKEARLRVCCMQENNCPQARSLLYSPANVSQSSACDSAGNNR